MSDKPFKIKIDIVYGGSDPAIPIYQTELKSVTGIWRETFGSQHDLDNYLKGVISCAHMLGFADIEVPEINNAPWLKEYILEKDK